MARTHHLDASQVHRAWDNALPPRMEIDPGDTVVFDTRDAADRYYSRASTHDDVMARGPFRGHPLTGPVRVRGARPGDVLVVDIVEVKPGAHLPDEVFEALSRKLKQVLGDPDDVANAVLYAVTQPIHVNLADLVVRPPKQLNL